jgi:hypothetical protein
VVAEGRPSALVAALYPVYFKVDSLIDVYSLLPQRGSIYSREGQRQRLQESRFDRRTGRLTFAEQRGTPLKELERDERPVTAGAHDPLSAIFALRSIPLSPGRSLSVPVVIEGRERRLRVTVADREPVACGLGRIPAWRLLPALDADGDPNDAKDIVLWLSDDARRLPVKLEAALPVGSFALTLTAAR